MENEGVSVNEVTLFAFNRNKADIARRNFMLKVAVVCSLGFLIFVCCCLFAGVLAKGWEIQGCVCLVGFVSLFPMASFGLLVSSTSSFRANKLEQLCKSFFFEVRKYSVTLRGICKFICLLVKVSLHLLHSTVIPNCL